MVEQKVICAPDFLYLLAAYVALFLVLLFASVVQDPKDQQEYSRELMLFRLLDSLAALNYHFLIATSKEQVS